MGIFTSANKVMFSPVSVCLSVIRIIIRRDKHDNQLFGVNNAKTGKRIDEANPGKKIEIVEGVMTA